MRIRFVRDAEPMFATDNERYARGRVADLRKAQWLIDNGYAVPVDATPVPPPTPEPEPEPEPEPRPDTGPNYEAMTVAMLRDELSIRGMPTSGRKADLIERLRG